MTVRSVNGAAARDYAYERLVELSQVIRSTRGTKREAAKNERDFLEGQLAIDCAEGRSRTQLLDPRFVEAVSKSTLKAT